MSSSGTAVAQPVETAGKADVHGIARYAAHAARLSDLCRGRKVKVRVEVPATLPAALADVEGSALIVVEGFEEALSKLSPDLDTLQWVALEPTTPSRIHGHPILPAHAPGALDAWLSVDAARTCARRRAAQATEQLAAVVTCETDGLVVLGASGEIVIFNPSARRILGDTLRVDGPLPFALPASGQHKIVTFGTSSILVKVCTGAWDGRPVRLIRLRPTADGPGFEGRLAHKDRLLAVGALAAGFAHEVNNPAQTVSADLAELSEQVRVLELGLTRARALVPREEQASFDALGFEHTLSDGRDLLQECFDGLGRIAGIVRDLKSFSRIQPDRVDWVHPNEVVNQACSIANNHIRHRARLVKDLTAFDPFPGDRNKLVQVVTNLLVNAAQALPETSEAARVWVQTRSDRDRVVISVIDTGPGIPPKVLERIFEPFFTTKGDTEGTGLGLAMSLDIARQHGGSIEVETTLGEGTRFDLVLPLRNGLSVPGKKAIPSAHDILHRGRVLVVDDEPGILRALGRLIGRNHEVVTRDGGRAALELLASDPDFDVILCDLMMPCVDGPALYEAIAQSNPELGRKMVFMSGGAFTQRAQGFLERVKPPVLDKPAPASVLEDAIQHTLARGEGISELPRPVPSGPPTRSIL